MPIVSDEPIAEENATWKLFGLLQRIQVISVENVPTVPPE
jgi:hypothetical protein